MACATHCEHHWMIPPVDGPRKKRWVTGVCKKCGVFSRFTNSHKELGDIQEIKTWLDTVIVDAIEAYADEYIDITGAQTDDEDDGYIRLVI